MEPEQTPVQKVGERNYQCPNYDACAAQVAANHWPVWTCSKCLHKLSGTGVSRVETLPTQTLSVQGQ